MKAYWLIVFVFIFAVGCASNPSNGHMPPDAEAADLDVYADAACDEREEKLSKVEPEVADPLESFNRTMFGVNDVLYFWVAQPVLQTYEKAVPRPARVGINNFFTNLTTPVRLVNSLLQGENEDAARELHRFGINTTKGVLGFGDPAGDQYHIEPAEADLGQTLGVYSVGEGFYIVWPVLGPSTVRDTAGRVGDAFLNPVRYVRPTETSIALSATDTVNSGSFRIGEYEVFKAAAVDPYVEMRTIYIQSRRAQIRDKTVAGENAESLPVNDYKEWED